MKKNNIFIISGPSGAGEDSIMESLKNRFNLERIVNTTTREMRPGESEGTPYYFLPKEEFIKRVEQGEFLEYAQQYNGNYSGVTKKEFERVNASGKVGLWKIEYKGVMTVKKIFPEIVAILVNAPNLEVLESRIRRRGNVSDEFIKERMDYTREWLKHTDIYDYTVINEEGKLEEAISKVAKIIKRHTVQ